MKLLIRLAPVLFVFFVATSSATSRDVLLNNIRVWSNAGGNNIIRVTTPGELIVNDWDCLDPDSYMVLSTMAKEAQTRIYAALLTARVTGSPITVRIDGCESNRPAIVSVYL